MHHICFICCCSVAISLWAPTFRIECGTIPGKPLRHRAPTKPLDNIHFRRCWCSNSPRYSAVLLTQGSTNTVRIMGETWQALNLAMLWHFDVYYCILCPCIIVLASSNVSVFRAVWYCNLFNAFQCIFSIHNFARTQSVVHLAQSALSTQVPGNMWTPKRLRLLRMNM